jgi:hypothetical protein
MTEHRKILDHILEKHTSPVIKPKPLQKKGMSSFEEPSLAESKPISSLDSTVEPSPKPEIPKKGVIHPSKFLIEFDDYGRTSNLPWHEENTFLSKEVSPNVKPSKESLKGTFREALHNLIVGTNIMLQFLAEIILGNMLLLPIDKLFKSPLGLIF